jgi:hypothetical protein
VALRPSREKTGTLEAARLFSFATSDAGEFGRAVHALLAAVAWREDGALEKLATAWRTEGFAGEEALGCLRAPALESVWSRPSPHAELWRERAFEIVLDGAWVTGVFDRVVVERDGGGRPLRMAIYDFKTDRGIEGPGLPEAVERHAAQLNLYRRVAAVLGGVPLAAVQCNLVFTRTAQRVTVSAR